MTSAQATTPAQVIPIPETKTLEWWIRAAVSLLIVLLLAWFTRYLEANVPKWLPEQAWVKSIEFPVYAILVGLAGGAVLRSVGLRDSRNRPVPARPGH